MGNVPLVEYFNSFLTWKGFYFSSQRGEFAYLGMCVSLANQNKGSHTEIIITSQLAKRIKEHEKYVGQELILPVEQQTREANCWLGQKQNKTSR